MNKIAADLKVDMKIVIMTVHDDLALKSYTRTPMHILTVYKGQYALKVQRNAQEPQVAWVHC